MPAETSTSTRRQHGREDAAALPSREALRGYATLLRGVLDGLGFAVLVVERSGAITMFNERFVTLLGSGGRGVQLDFRAVVEELRRLVSDPDSLGRALLEALREPERAGELELALRDGGALAVSVARLQDDPDARVVCLRDATGELQARRELEHRAMHDALTGLPNRELLLDRLSVALARRTRAGTSVGVLFIDLDGFKAINDEHGHAVGDQLLVAVAQRLTREVRDGDTVARFGGDEFVVLCEDLGSDQLAAPLARRLADAIAQPLTAGGALLAVRASIGVVLESDPSVTPELLLARADGEMYRVKRRRGAVA